MKDFLSEEEFLRYQAQVLLRWARRYGIALEHAIQLFARRLRQKQKNHERTKWKN